VLDEFVAGVGQPPEERRILLLYGEAEPDLTRELARHGHEVLAVGGDELPTRLLGVFKPDVVLVAASDVPRACLELRQQAADVPIVAIVRGGDLDARIAALSAGADDCLSTPFDRLELLARIQAVTRTKGPSAESLRGAGERPRGGVA
jgi:DNA-binding response OmpR family regulator